jgi:transketolase
LKPFDDDAVLRASAETGVVVTAEAPDRRAGVESQLLHYRESWALWDTGHQGYIGVKDCFGDSGAPSELIKEFEVSAEHIAQKAGELMGCERAKGIAEEMLVR